MKAHRKVSKLSYELYFLNNQFFEDLGSYRQFWIYDGCNQRIFFFVEGVGGHFDFVKLPFLQQFPPFVILQEISKIQIADKNMCLKPSVLPFNCIICSWKLDICAVKHIPKIDWKCWYTTWIIDTETPNITIFEVVQNSICTISILIANQSSKLVTWVLNIIWWYKYRSTDHSKMQSKFWIIYVAFLQPWLLNAFPHIGT